MRWYRMKQEINNALPWIAYRINPLKPLTGTRRPGQKNAPHHKYPTNHIAQNTTALNIRPERRTKNEGINPKVCHGTSIYTKILIDSLNNPQNKDYKQRLYKNESESFVHSGRQLFALRNQCKQN